MHYCKPRFVSCATGLVIAFSVHGLLQEWIIQYQGLSGGATLALVELFGITVFSSIELYITKGSLQRCAPLYAYGTLCVFLLLSTVLGNWALDFINYPTRVRHSMSTVFAFTMCAQVAFRSCKLIPTMILSAILHRRRVSLMQILFALAVSVGLIIFLVADANVSPRFHSLGYILAALSVTADALMVLCQENVFKYGASVEEATFWGTALSFLALILQSVFFGDVREILANMPSKNAYNGVVMAAHALVSYVAVFFHLKMVKEWGSVNTVLVGSSRRALSVILSFLVFPKPFSLLYVVGATLVFGGLVGSGYTNKRAQDFKAPTLSTANAVKSGDPAASNSV